MESVPATGGDVTYTVTVTNETAEDVYLAGLTDDVFGFLDGAGSCDADSSVTIEAGETYECAFTELVAGEPGTAHVNTVTATAHDDDGNDAEAQASASVDLLGAGEEPDEPDGSLDNQTNYPDAPTPAATPTPTAELEPEDKDGGDGDGHERDKDEHDKDKKDSERRGHISPPNTGDAGLR